MDRKFLIVLLATIFYNGVTHSSPIEAQRTAEAGLPEEKPPTPTKSNVSDLVVESQNVTAAKIESAHQDIQGTVQVDGKNALQNAPIVQGKIPATNVTATATSTATVTATATAATTTTTTTAAAITAPTPESKSPATVVDSKTVNQTTERKNVSQAINAHNATQPATAGATGKSETTVVAGGKNGKEVSTPQSTTVSLISTTSVPTTTKVSVTKPTGSTVSPNAATTKESSVIAEQSTPAPPVQEKHFDGPSFFGGIVLTIGLTAIGFIAFKYYKSGKIDMNYRTL